MIRRHFLPWVLLALASIATAQFSPSGRDRERSERSEGLSQQVPLLITGGTVHLPGGKTAVTSILVRDGKIALIDPGRGTSSGATTFDAKGLHIYPGFIDAYSTSGLKLPDSSPPAAVAPSAAASDTAPTRLDPALRRTIRSDWQAAKMLNFKDNLSQLYKQGLTAAQVSAGMGGFRGTTAVVQYLDADPATVTLSPGFAIDIAFRSPGGTGGYPGSLMGIIALMRQTLYDAQYYDTLRRLKPAETKEDPQLAGLVPLFKKEKPALFLADNEREVGRAFQMAEEFNFSIIINSGREAYKWADKLKATNTSVILSPSAGQTPSRTPAANDTTPVPVLEERYQTWLARANGAQTLAKEGVRFAFSSDGDALGDFLTNIRGQIARGLPESAAVQALTSDAAAILGLGSQLGSIEVGKIANLTILTDGLAKETAKVSAVVVAGQLIRVEGPTP